MDTRSLKMSFLIISSLFTCALLAFIEHGISINYSFKTISKIGLFLMNILVFKTVFKDFSLKRVLAIHRMTRHEWSRLLMLGGISALIVWIAYIISSPYLDLQSIKDDLVNRLGLTPLSFIFVGLYITFGNSFLEEYYFRGFIFYNLPKFWGYIYSPLLFATYHIPMIVLWFNPLLIGICFLGLWGIGVIFHFVNNRNHTIWSSWIIHICADIVIVLIGSTLFFS